MLGQLLNRVTPMKSDTLLAVDKRDLRLAGGGGRKAGIVREIAVGGQFAYVHHIRAQRARVHRSDRSPAGFRPHA